MYSNLKVNGITEINNNLLLNNNIFIDNYNSSNNFNKQTINNGLNIINQINSITYNKILNNNLQSGYDINEIFDISDLSHNIYIDTNYNKINMLGLLPYHTSAIRELYNNGNSFEFTLPSSGNKVKFKLTGETTPFLI